MSHARFWDLSTRERAALSMTDVEKYLAVELMEKGVLLPREPDLEPVPPGPAEMAKKAMFTLTKKSRYGGTENIGVAFMTIADAEAFLRLSVRFIEHDHESKCEVGTVPTGSKTVSIEVLDELDHARAKTLIVERKGAIERNETRLKRYKEQIEKAKTESADIWKNWRACCALEHELRQVRKTFDDYCEITKGDKAAARTFLEKTYTPEKVAAALDAPENKDDRTANDDIIDRLVEEKKDEEDDIPY